MGAGKSKSEDIAERTRSEDIELENQGNPIEVLVSETSKGLEI